MTNHRLKLTLALASALLAGHSAAQEEDKKSTSESVAQASLPDGFEVLDKHVEAVGGYEKNKKFKSIRMSGTFKMPAMNVEGTIEVNNKAPSSAVIKVDLGAMGSVEQGTNGIVAWARQPGQPMQIIEGPDAEQLKNQSQFYASVEPRKTYTEAETVSIVDHDGTKCYKLNLVTSWGEHQVGLYSVETGLLRKMSVRADAESDVYTNETAFSDYKEIEGIKHARTLKLKNNGFEQEMTFDTVELNPEFEKGLFDPPGSF